jgi:hypothetical protein
MVPSSTWLLKGNQGDRVPCYIVKCSAPIVRGGYSLRKWPWSRKEYRSEQIFSVMDRSTLEPKPVLTSTLSHFSGVRTTTSFTLVGCTCNHPATLGKPGMRISWTLATQGEGQLFKQPRTQVLCLQQEIVDMGSRFTGQRGNPSESSRLLRDFETERWDACSLRGERPWTSIYVKLVRLLEPTSRYESKVG